MRVAAAHELLVTHPTGIGRHEVCIEPQTPIRPTKTRLFDFIPSAWNHAVH